MSVQGVLVHGSEPRPLRARYGALSHPLLMQREVADGRQMRVDQVVEVDQRHIT